MAYALIGAFRRAVGSRSAESRCRQKGELWTARFLDAYGEDEDPGDGPDEGPEESLSNEQVHLIARTSLQDIPGGLLAQWLAPHLDLASLLALLAAGRGCEGHLPTFVDRCAAVLHGTAPGEVTSRRALAKLCAVPTHRSVKFARRVEELEQECGLRLVRGSRLEYPIYVGRTETVTMAVNPPAVNDTFVLTVPLQRGRYAVAVSGWTNPFHGVLSVSVDGQVVEGLGAVNWRQSGSAGSHTAVGQLYLERSGPHEWEFKVLGPGSDDHCWLCLEELRVEVLDQPAKSVKARPETRSLLPRFLSRSRACSS